MVTVWAVGATAPQTQPGFYLMLAVLAGGVIASTVVAWRNHHHR